MKKTISLILTFCVLASFANCFSFASAETTNVNLVYENFDSIDVETKPETVNSAFSTSALLNSSVDVRIDPLTGSKALRIYSPEGQTDMNGFSVSLGSQTEGIFVCEFKLRIEKSSTKLGKIYFSNKNNKRVSLTNKAFVLTDEENDVDLCDLSDRNYKNIRYVLDLNEGMYTVNVDDGEIVEGGMRSSIDKFELYTSANAPSSDWLCNDSGDSIYWVDDFRFSRLMMAVEKTSPPNNALNVSLDSKISITYNCDVDSSTVNAENIKIYKDNELVKSEDLKFSASGKTVHITFLNKMDYNSLYKVCMSKNIATNIDGVVPTDMDYEFEFRSERMIPVLSGITDGGRYNGSVTPIFEGVLPNDVTVVTTLKKDNSEEVSYTLGTPVSEVGAYELIVFATNSEGKVHRDVYNFSIVGASPPEVLGIEVTCDGEIRKNSIITATYTYFDINGDEEKESIGRWYSSDYPDRGFSPCSDEEILSNGKSTYEITENNKYYQFSVIPKSETATENIGEIVYSSSFTGAFLPIAYDVVLKGSAKLDDIISVDYKFSDVNNEAKENAKIVWSKKTVEGASYVTIKEGFDDTYKITTDDVDCVIKATVFPAKGKISLVYGEGVDSNTVISPSSPVVSQVKINGQINVGQGIYVTYLCEDPNGDPIKEAKVEWYCGNTLVGTQSGITLEPYMAGKFIYASVTPISDVYPYSGKTVSTSPFMVSYSSVSPSVSGGSSSGGSFGGSSSSAVKPTETPKQPENPATQEKNETAFSDVKNHWAESSITKMLEKGIVNGVTQNEFMPDKSVTRAEAATLIARAFSLTSETKEEFNDVGDEWFKDSILAVENAGYMKGANGFFRPNDKITREEIAVVFYNIIGKKAISEELSDELFSDSSSWAVDALKYAYKNGLITGMDDGKIYPKNDTTRAQFVVILDRFMALQTENAGEEAGNEA